MLRLPLSYGLADILLHATPAWANDKVLIILSGDRVRSTCQPPRAH